MADYDRISITIEPELLARLDAHIAAAGHGNRSEAIRDLIRGALTRSAPDEVVVAASLTVVFDHRQRALADRMVSAAHDHHTLVLSTLHVHLDPDTCMELSALRGSGAQLRHYCAHLLGMKGVLHGQLVIAGPVG